MLYEHIGNDGQVDERVDVVPDSPEQLRLAASEDWVQRAPDGTPIPENAAKLPPNEDGGEASEPAAAKAKSGKATAAAQTEA